MPRFAQILVFALLTFVFVAGTAMATLHGEPALACISFLASVLSVGWLYVVVKSRPQVLPMSKVSVIGAHVQDTTTLTGSSAQFFGSL